MPPISTVYSPTGVRIQPLDRRPADLGPVIHVSASGCRYHADSLEAARERAIHALLQAAAGQPDARDMAAGYWERHAADVTATRAASIQAVIPVMDSRMREAK